MSDARLLFLEPHPYVNDVKFQLLTLRFKVLFNGSDPPFWFGLLPTPLLPFTEVWSPPSAVSSTCCFFWFNFQLSTTLSLSDPDQAIAFSMQVGTLLSFNKGCLIHLLIQQTFSAELQCARHCSSQRVKTPQLAFYHTLALIIYNKELTFISNVLLPAVCQVLPDVYYFLFPVTFWSEDWYPPFLRRSSEAQRNWMIFPAGIHSWLSGSRTPLSATIPLGLPTWPSLPLPWASWHHF